MSVPFLDLHVQYRTIAEELDAAVMDVVRSQRFVLGEHVDRLEEELAERLGVAHAIGCASGTDALLLPLLYPELTTEQKDRVISAVTRGR